MWIYPTSLTGSQRFLTKGTNATGGFHLFAFDNVNKSDVNWSVRRATTNCNYVTNSAPIPFANEWYFLVVTFASAATPTTHIYCGTLIKPATECTYGTTTDGSGSVNVQGSGQPLFWLNGGSPQVGSFKGSVQIVGAYNSVLSLGDVLRLQQKTLVRTIPLCVDFHNFGTCGVSLVPDLTGNGNSGTITGAVPDNNILPRIIWAL
jgi:hypothetical protein